MDNPVVLHNGDCLSILPTLPDNSVDAVITDPPYELGFMGKKWDNTGIAYNVELWREVLRVLKPGGHLLSFGGSRTYHRMAVAIEDAGFEVRDQIMWLYGSGFPKSHNIGKAIDAAAGADREVVGMKEKNGGGRAASSHDGWRRPWMNEDGAREKVFQITAPATAAAAQWEGWGTALKPAHEPICVARKPLSESTVADNVLRWGTGAVNVDGCRVDADAAYLDGNANPEKGNKVHGGVYGWANCEKDVRRPPNPQGRWPANVCHDGSEEVVGLFPVTSAASGYKAQGYHNCHDDYKRPGSSMFVRMNKNEFNGVSDNGGSAARFFNECQPDNDDVARFMYCAKASKKDRNDGLDGFDAKIRNDGRDESLKSGDMPQNRSNNPKRNHHPTVKPTDLMRWLCRLITPPGGIVLDPFMGSGSTGKAAVLEGFNFIGIEKDAEYFAIAQARIAAATEQKQGKLEFGD